MYRRGMKVMHKPSGRVCKIEDIMGRNVKVRYSDGRGSWVQMRNLRKRS